MKQKFFELTTEAAKALQGQCSCQNGDTVCSISLEKYQVNFALQPESNILTLQVGVAILPNHNKLAFCEKILSMNNSLQESKGLTFGLEEELELITLQINWYMDLLDTKSFIHLLDHFISTALDAMLAIEKIQTNLSLS